MWQSCCELISSFKCEVSDLGLPPCDWEKPGQIAQPERVGHGAAPMEWRGSGRTPVAVQGGIGQARAITSSDSEHEINRFIS